MKAIGTAIGGSRPVLLGALAGLTCAAVSAAPARAQTSPDPFGPWDGSNPFKCELQYAGTGAVGPHPEVDPYCVEFDKTNQNVTDFGLIQFLSQEPPRVGAAANKCFYYQRDHWTGSIVQGSEPAVWHWDGDYFFDKAKGIGGVHVENFEVGGQPADGSQYAPDPYKPFFEETGGGGVITELESGPDPRCAARIDEPEERERIYRSEPQFKRCIPPGGELLGRRVGRAKLGMERRKVLNRLGPPRSRERGTDRWCVTGAASLRVAYRRGSPRGVALIRTTSLGHTERGVGTGTKARKAKRRIDLERRFRIKGTRVFEAPRRYGRRLFAGIRAHRVRWLAMTDPDRLRGRRATKRALRRAR